MCQMLLQAQGTQWGTEQSSHLREHTLGWVWPNIYTHISRCLGLRSHQTSWKDEVVRVFYPERSGFLRTSPLYCVKGGVGMEQ